MICRQATGRRLELLAGRTADAALLALYEEIAAIWRRLHELGDKKSRLQQLRCALCARQGGTRGYCLLAGTPCVL